MESRGRSELLALPAVAGVSINLSLMFSHDFILLYCGKGKTVESPTYDVTSVF
jgi:hypothetical protein